MTDPWPEHLDRASWHRRDQLSFGKPRGRNHRGAPVYDDGLTKLTLVTPSCSRSDQMWTWEFSMLANRETAFSPGVYEPCARTDIHTSAILAYRETRAVGLLTFECGKAMAQVSWDSGSWRQGFPSVRLAPAPAQWAIAHVWVARALRRCGLGRLMVQYAAACVSLHPSQLAWCVPFTPLGEALARSTCPESVLVAR